MKTFKGQTHYEILDVSIDADVGEIRRAYRDALALYDDDALATYALFSDAQRAEVLAAVETAYQILVDETRRAAYNQELLSSGAVEPSFFSVKDQKHLAARAENLSARESLAQWVKRKSGEPVIRERIDALLCGERISGLDLKGLREALGIEPGEIYELTRISNRMLAAIENDRFEELPAEIFVKQFLSSLAEIFQIDSRHVISGYLGNMSANT